MDDQPLMHDPCVIVEKRPASGPIDTPTDHFIHRHIAI
jgi:hypothetical protein